MVTGNSLTLELFAFGLAIAFRGSKAQFDNCDIAEDTCPYQFDGECDSALPECFNGDCFDCHFCLGFFYDCEGCLANGCYWCPGDATCVSTPYLFEHKVASCSTVTDYADSCTSPKNLFSDPLYLAQEWVYDLVNVKESWENGYTGAGITIRVNDNGVDSTHPEFQANFDESMSCPDHLPNFQDSDHGTSVASIAAGGANNGACAVGIAPEATISACNTENFEAFLDYKLDTFDISQNSYGTDACVRDTDPFSRRMRRLQQTCPFSDISHSTLDPCEVCNGEFSSTRTEECTIAIIDHCINSYNQDPNGCLEFLDLLIGGDRCFYNAMSPDDEEAITNAILNGRDGLGTLFVFAAGNEFDVGEVVNMEGQLNSRFTITVGAVGKDTIHSSYSTGGAALFISAPGGDEKFLTNMIGAKVGGGCHDATVGTSFACPVVSGVIALILEARPNLTWRDVQGVLAETAQLVENNPSDTTRITNAAGYMHSHLYGFGIVDAGSAVETALEWEYWSEEKMVVGDSGQINLTIPDGSSNVSSTIEISEEGTEDYIVESVVVYLTLQHYSRGDLDVTLTSPSDTKSLLMPGNYPENTQLQEDDEWKLLTVRNWGETSHGRWTLTISDISPSYVSDCVDDNAFEIDGAHCGLIESREICADGTYNLEVVEALAGPDYAETFPLLADNGRTILDACCACGGGMRGTGDTFTDQLIRWRVVVYAHDDSPASSKKSKKGKGKSRGKKGKKKSKKKSKGQSRKR